MKDILTVSEITGEIKKRLEYEFESVRVIGEISNFKAHISGHWYFSLKDADASINCTMWKGLNSYIFFTPQNGMKVIANGRITVYPPRGNYQLDIKSMKPAGEGELQAAFEKLKANLAAEGLFESRYKKQIPAWPKRIGLICGAGSAAYEDLITTAERRYPYVEIIYVPTKVQGDGAAQEISHNINLLNSLKKIDIIIVARGGGSLEDLWAFNEDVVARSIFDSKIPIITGIGHDIDFTIADFVADLRAPTPTAAMELATPDQIEIFKLIKDLKYSVENNIFDIIEHKKLGISQIIKSYGFRIPEGKVKTFYQLMDHITFRLNSTIFSKLNAINSRLQLFEKVSESSDPKRILRKGYTMITQNQKIIERAVKLEISNPFLIKFYDKDLEVPGNVQN